MAIVKVVCGNKFRRRLLIMNNNSDQTGSIKLFARGTSGRIEFHNATSQIMSVRADNNVYIGVPDPPGPSSNLYVNGEINAKLVRVKNDIPWWDGVFKPHYKLMSLSELETFVKQNNHLPDMPTEKQVNENGLDLAKMNALLLKKVEELTLYVIELKKENERIKEVIENMKKR